MVTQDDILAQLEQLKKKPRDYLSPKDYRAFLPNKLAVKQHNTSRKANLEFQRGNILDKDKTVSETSDIMHRNKKDYEDMLAAEKNMAAAQKALKKAKKMQRPVIQQPDRTVNVPIAQYPVTMPGKQGQQNFNIPKGAMQTGGNPTPGLGNVSTSNVTTVRTPYGPITVNPQAADNFQGFLKALAGTGYKVSSLGSHAIRNIAGTSTPSLHSYGLAIDINPSANPVSYGNVITNLPKGIGRLAAKYGLVWGGNWQGSKKDAMHFSIPYNGTK